MANNGGRRTGSAGRFGARYGRVARRRVAQIEAETNADHGCPECGKDDVERRGTGIWECAACGYRFAGGTYRPQTPGGRSARRSIRTALAEEGGEVTEVAEDVDETAAEDAATPEP